MPQHIHALSGSKANGDTAVPTGAVPARTLGNRYGTPVNLVSLVPATVPNVGGSQAHTNMQPYLVLNFVIALQGIFPSQT